MTDIELTDDSDVQDKQPITEEITGLHGICKIPNHSKIIVNTNTKEECESIIQQILDSLKALEELPKLKENKDWLQKCYDGVSNANHELFYKKESLQQENQKLKTEIEELKKFSQGVEFGNAHVMPESSYQFQRQQLQESKQAIEILPQLKEICKLYIRTKQKEIAQISVEMTGKSYQECQTAIAKIEIIQYEIEKIQSILKGEKKKV